MQLSHSLPGVPGESPLQAARRLAPLAASLAVQNERDRALAPELVEQLRDSGLLHLCLPRSAGGPEASAAELFEALEILGRADGASGWCAMIASTTAVLGAYLSAEDSEAIFARGRSIAGGVFAPRGRARRAGDELLVSGRWSFVSGIGHSDWMFGGCMVEGEEGTELLDGGRPDVRLWRMAKQELEVIDTWSVSGLCATGSHDVAAEGLHVAAGAASRLFSDAPREDGPLYAFPLFGLLALGIAAVSLWESPAERSTPSSSWPAPSAPLREPARSPSAPPSRPSSPGPRPRCAPPGRWRSSRSRRRGTAAEAGDPLTDRLKLGLRLAATHATATRCRGGHGDVPRRRRQLDLRRQSPAALLPGRQRGDPAHDGRARRRWELSGRLLLGAADRHLPAVDGARSAG